MIYRSNLICPDLTPHFKHLVSRPMPHSFGHDVPSDWADKSGDDPVFGIYKKCGLWTHDEAAILFNVAICTEGQWLDIGSHTGWTTKHLMAAILHPVHMVEPMYGVEEFLQRMYSNVFRSADIHWLSTHQCALSVPCPLRSDQFWEAFGGFGLAGDGSRVCPETFAGFCIDGCHEPGQPLRDAQNCVKHLADTGVIMLHDGVGRPVREAVEWLMGHHEDCARFGGPAYDCDCGRGFKARAYFTPHLVFCCWRGDFTPPDHVPDPLVKAAHLDGRYPDFDFARCI